MRTYTEVPIKYDNLWAMIEDRACDKFAMSEEDYAAKLKELEDSIASKPASDKEYLRMQFNNEMNKSWSISKLFSYLGISTQTLYSMRKGYGITLSTIDKLCTFFKCQPSEIMEISCGD